MYNEQLIKKKNKLSKNKLNKGSFEIIKKLLYILIFLFNM